MIEYGKLELSDEDIATQFYETYLNAGPAVRDYIRTGLRTEGFVGYKCTDTETGKVIGMMSARPGIEFTCDHPELVEMVKERWGTQGVYTVDMQIVEPEYRKHGVGRQLAVLLQQGLRKHHAKCMVLELWIRHREKDVPALHPMQKAWKEANIVPLTVVDDFYKNLADYGLTCPECGSDCKCGALIAMLVLNGSSGGERRHEEEEA